MVLENWDNIQQSRIKKSSSQKQEPGETQVTNEIIWYLDCANKKAPSPGFWSSKALFNSTALVQSSQYSDSVLKSYVSERNGRKIKICIYTHFFMVMYKKD